MQKLSDFNLNKQSLKRKLKHVIDSQRENVEKLLDRRTTLYTIEEIEYIIKSIYGGESKYYLEHNKEKSEKLVSLINIKKGNNSLNKDIRNIVKKSQNEVMKFEDFNDKLRKISELYNTSFDEVVKIANEIEIEYLTQLN